MTTGQWWRETMPWSAANSVSRRPTKERQTREAVGRPGTAPFSPQLLCRVLSTDVRLCVYTPQLHYS